MGCRQQRAPGCTRPCITRPTMTAVWPSCQTWRSSTRIWAGFEGWLGTSMPSRAWSRCLPLCQRGLWTPAPAVSGRKSVQVTPCCRSRGCTAAAAWWNCCASAFSAAPASTTATMRRLMPMARAMMAISSTQLPAAPSQPAAGTTSTRASARAVPFVKPQAALRRPEAPSSVMQRLPVEQKAQERCLAAGVACSRRPSPLSASRRPSKSGGRVTLSWLAAKTVSAGSWCSSAASGSGAATGVLPQRPNRRHGAAACCSCCGSGGGAAAAAAGLPSPPKRRRGAEGWRWGF
mmetsp:Transcript_105235/g.339437  ORF Transcript_105235/g.339437 Transcript_105235/m.339437 type:complete len:290 (-) Transcript_105235:1485-2354(-)